MDAPTPSLERYRVRMREESLREMLVSSCARTESRINLGILPVLVLSEFISLEDDDADDNERDWTLSVLLVAVVALSKEISSAAQFDSNEDNNMTDTLLCLMVFSV